MCGGPAQGRDLASADEPVTCSDCIKLALTGWCPVLGTCPERQPKPKPEKPKPAPTGDRSKATLTGRTRTNLGSGNVRRPES